MRIGRFPLWCCTATSGILLALALASGCASDSQKHPTSHPGDQALADPMYKPTDDYPDISGGGLMHFDKQGFEKDVDDVFNP